MNNNDTTPLPAFLRRRNDRLELVLHCTWVQDYYICPRKFWLRYGECVESTGPRTALNYGGAVHDALEHRYRNPNQPLATIDQAQMDLLTAWFDANPQPSDEWCNCGRAQALIRAYNEQYPAEEWEVLAVEEAFEVEVGGVFVGNEDSGAGELVTVYLAGRKDLVVAWHDGLWVVDHKTASDWGSGDSNAHLDEGRRSFQFRGYAWSELARQRKLEREGELDELDLRNRLPILGTVGNYLISRKPYANPDAKPRAGAKPRNQFHRECYPFELSVLDEWRSTFFHVAEDILRDWQRGYWQDKDTGCGHWGRCEFYDYCEEAPERREAMLSSSLFREKTFEREL